MIALVTGGAGFIGTNLSLRLLADGHDVVVIDSLVRPGTERNLAILRASRRANSAFKFFKGDVACFATVERLVREADVIFHLAAQVSVVGAIRDPVADFQSNAIGTFNVLEAARKTSHAPAVLVASTNKVYGTLDHHLPVELTSRWTLPGKPHGVSEQEPLRPVTPYACSKGFGDLYALDYARTYGVKAVVFRQSCIYGTHQQATEEQAWVAWFVKAALAGRAITIFGDGKQVRDLLHVEDLVDLYLRAMAAIDRVAGRAFNVGGGPDKTISIWQEFSELLQERIGRFLPVEFKPPRPGDQRVFVSDIRQVGSELGWTPRIGLRDGVAELCTTMQRAMSG